MKTRVLGLLFLFSYLTSFAQQYQPICRRWDYRYGGNLLENIKTLLNTSDGGYLLGGTTGSDSSGDVSEHIIGNNDFWIVKTDANGVKQWDKRYGGAVQEMLSNAQQTADGGYIIAGITNSDSSIDVSERGTGGFDYWMIKVDALGHKQWDKRFGGYGNDYLSWVEQTSDKGYILVGRTLSGIGGDVSQATRDTSNNSNLQGDCWVVKTDSLGHKLWDKRFGGKLFENPSCIIQTNDGGYLLGARTFSGIGLDISQPSRDNVAFAGDFWILKMDASGIKQWDKRYGGQWEDALYSLKQLKDHGFILAGTTQSPVSGEVTQAPHGLNDYWAVRIDSVGNKLWDKRYGGNANQDDFGYVKVTLDGGFLFSGTAYGNASLDKSENNLGNEQSWIIKTDSLGNRTWDKTIFTRALGDDENGYAVESADGCYVVANSTSADTGGYKTQSKRGLDDFWFVKLCDTTHFFSSFFASTALCDSGCITFQNTSRNAIHYQWLFPGSSRSSDTAANPTPVCYNVPGSYSAILIAYGSSGTDTFITQLQVYRSPQLTITANDTTLCPGQTATLCAQTGYISYHWNTNNSTGACASTSLAGNYWVTATDNNGCTAVSNHVHVSSLLNPVVHIFATPDTMCPHDTAVICATQGFVSYDWLGRNAHTPCITVTAAGNYDLIATDSNGCSAKSGPIALVMRQAPAAVVTGATSICGGDTVQICVQPNFLSYLWSNGDTLPCFNTSQPGNYHVTTLDQFGCTAISNQITLGSYPMPIPPVISANPPVVCSNGLTSICAAAGFTTYTWDSAGIGSGQCVAVSRPGTYDVTVTDSHGCSAVSNQITVGTATAPTVAITATKLTFCPGDSTTLCSPAGFMTYHWSNGNSTNCFTTLNGGNYRLTVNDFNGCSAVSNSIVVVVRPAPIASVLGGTSSLCGTDTITICAGAGFSSYHWSRGETTPCLTTWQAGNYFVTTTDSFGCTATSNNVALSAYPLPNVVIAANPPVICSNGSTAICATSGFASYVWDTTSIGNSACVAVTRPGTYYVRVTDSHGCTAISNQLPLVAATAPTVAITASHPALCPGDTVTICAPSNFMLYHWSTGSSGPCISTLSVGTYRITVNDFNGCSAVSNMITLNAHGNPTVTISATQTSICSNDTVVICPGANFAAYHWSTGDSTFCINTSQTGTYIVTVTDAFSCTASSNPVVISANQAPTCTITTTSQIVCGGDSAHLCITSAFLTYHWSTGSSNRCIYVSQPGTYRATVTGSNGCSAVSNSIVITSGSTWGSVAITANPSAICNNDTAFICAPTGFAHYHWSQGDTLSCINTVQAGNYSVSVTDVNGCSAVSNPIAIVVHAPPSVIVTVQPNTICAYDTATICATAGLANYHWNTSATGNCFTTSIAGNYFVTVTDTSGCTATSNPVSLTTLPAPLCTINTNTTTICSLDSALICASSSFAHYQWNTGGNNQCISTTHTGSFYVIVTDNNGCTAVSNNIVITAASATTCAITTGTPNICVHDTAIICATPGFLIYQWNTGNGGTCISATSAGNYYVTATDSIGCIAISNQLSIADFATPSATASVNPGVICANDTALLCATTGFNRYQWNVGDTAVCIKKSQGGNYYVTVTDNNGCTAESNHVSLTVFPNPPVAISVNGDTLVAYNAVTYQWYLNGVAINGATSRIYVTHLQGLYSVAVTDSNGCHETSSPVVFSGIDDLQSAKFEVYPNPSFDAWQLVIDPQIIGKTVEVFDMEGRLVYRAEITNQHSQIKFAAERGVYLLRISQVGPALLKLVKL
ncbi:MAG: domain containing protein [Bacteroidota bacterium]|nr:domain containing protein [Bacteroidota bacterium]